jgi:hypothetical protein
VAHKGSHELSDAHPAIIPLNEWEAVQREAGTVRKATDNLLTGMVRCHGCGYSMGAGADGHGNRRYNCGRHHAHMRCPSPTTAPTGSLERIVTEAFLDHYGDIQVEGTDARTPAVTEAENALQRARSEYETWRDDAEMRSIVGDADYREGLVARKTAVTAAERLYGEAIRESNAGGLSVDPALWESLSRSEQRELMRSGVDAIVLRRAASSHALLADRVEIVWAGELEHDGSPAGIAAAIRSRP